MAVLAHLARYRVTLGADQWVPISGVMGACLRGQVTRPGYWSTGAARSEPRAPCATPAGTLSTLTYRPGGAGVPGGVPGVRGARGAPRCAHCPR